jgi:hypothetical protein
MNNEKQIEAIKRVVVDEVNCFILDDKKITWNDVAARSKKASYVKVRAMVCVLLKDILNMKVVDIGKEIKRDHSNVTYMINTVHITLYNSEKVYRQVYDNVISKYLGMQAGTEFVTYDVRSYIKRVIDMEKQLNEMKTELINLLSGEHDKDREQIKVQKYRLLKELAKLEME